jgi:hypothetical protein
MGAARVALPAGFESSRQRARACRALLALVDATGCWTPHGPAPDALVAPPEQPDAQRLLALCWALWNGCSTLVLSELLLLSPRPLEAVGELLVALARGPAAIDGWLARFEPVPRPLESRAPPPPRRNRLVSR